MRKRSALLIIAIFLGTILFTGCSNSNKSNPLLIGDKKQTTSADTNSTVPKKQIALVMKTLTNPFFVEMEKGARKAEQEFNITLIVKTGAKETSIDQQISIIDELIRDKVDAIVIAPASSTDLLPVLKRAQDANITIVNIDNRLDPILAKQIGLKEIPFISVNNEQGAYLSAKYISDKITRPTNVLILEGIRSAQNAVDRKNGALRAFKENKMIQSIDIETANWKIDEAYHVTELAFQNRPDIGAIFCSNDMMALGAVKFLTETKRSTVLVAGFDALDEAKKAIRNGELAITIDQQADLQGYTGVKTALQLLNGEQVSPETLVDVRAIDAGNL